jgi:hypothetical protein
MRQKIAFVLLLSIILGCKQKIDQNGIEKTKGHIEEVNPTKVRFAKMEEDALKETFKGILTKNGKTNDLFPIRSTGVSTFPMQQSAEKFLNSLTPSQKDRSTFDIDNEEWRKWCNVDNGIYDRQGVSLKEMTEIQKKMAFNLIQVSLSAKGNGL